MRKVSQSSRETENLYRRLQQSKLLSVTEMLNAYQDRHFVLPNGTLNLMTNVQFVNGLMRSRGFVQNGKEQDYKDLHIFPVDYFCPRQTTGEYIRTEHTYCDHLGIDSWSESIVSWKSIVRKLVGQRGMIYLIKLKRKVFG